MSDKLYQPTCISCPHDLYFCDTIPKRQFGVMMHCGEHYCTGGKRARRFKRGDPKINVPGWCPKRKAPCEVRVYAFKNADEWYLHTELSRLAGDAILPTGFRYALKTELSTELTPYEFWKCCDYEPYEELIRMRLQRYEVLEIDDGLKPAFFYMTENGLVLEHNFDATAARKNKLEGSV